MRRIFLTAVVTWAVAGVVVLTQHSVEDSTPALTLTTTGEIPLEHWKSLTPDDATTIEALRPYSTTPSTRPPTPSAQYRVREIAEFIAGLSLLYCGMWLAHNGRDLVGGPVALVFIICGSVFIGHATLLFTR